LETEVTDEEFDQDLEAFLKTDDPDPSLEEHSESMRTYVDNLRYRAEQAEEEISRLVGNCNFQRARARKAEAQQVYLGWTVWMEAGDWLQRQFDGKLVYNVRTMREACPYPEDETKETE
jgi:hypothetical protein